MLTITLKLSCRTISEQIPIYLRSPKHLLPSANNLRRPGNLVPSIFIVKIFSRTRTSAPKRKQSKITWTSSPEYLYNELPSPNDHPKNSCYLQIVNIPNASLTPNTNVLTPDVPHLAASDDRPKIPTYYQIAKIPNADTNILVPDYIQSFDNRRP